MKFPLSKNEAIVALIVLELFAAMLAVLLAAQLQSSYRPPQRTYIDLFFRAWVSMHVFIVGIILMTAFAVWFTGD